MNEQQIRHEEAELEVWELAEGVEAAQAERPAARQFGLRASQLELIGSLLARLYTAGRRPGGLQHALGAALKAVRPSVYGEMTLRELLALMRGACGECLAALEALYERCQMQDQLTISLRWGERSLRIMARKASGRRGREGRTEGT